MSDILHPPSDILKAMSEVLKATLDREMRPVTRMDVLEWGDEGFNYTGK